MKKCPYCAEEIQDEAIKCRYCFSDLTVAPEDAMKQKPEPTAAPTATPGSTIPTGAATDPGTGGASVRYTHSGYRYVLGYGADYFGIWDRQSPTEPTERFSRTDEGWREAWVRFAGLEPNNTVVPDENAAGGPPLEDPSDTDVLQYTHSGSRYLLGYGRTFFGIWDRQNPSTPVERFPRSDEGWADAWRRYTQIESNYAEVKPNP